MESGKELKITDTVLEAYSASSVISYVWRIVVRNEYAITIDSKPYMNQIPVLIR
jgi:hypothetical protein